MDPINFLSKTEEPEEKKSTKHGVVFSVIILFLILTFIIFYLFHDLALIVITFCGLFIIWRLAILMTCFHLVFFGKVCGRIIFWQIYWRGRINIYLLRAKVINLFVLAISKVALAGQKIFKLMAWIFYKQPVSLAKKSTDGLKAVFLWPGKKMARTFNTLKLRREKRRRQIAKSKEKLAPPKVKAQTPVLTQEAAQPTVDLKKAAEEPTPAILTEEKEGIKETSAMEKIAWPEISLKPIVPIVQETVSFPAKSKTKPFRQKTAWRAKSPYFSKPKTTHWFRYPLFQGLKNTLGLFVIVFFKLPVRLAVKWGGGLKNIFT